MEQLLAQPIEYYVAVALLFLLGVEGLAKSHIAWRMPYLVVLLTIGGWYLIEPVYLPQEFESFDPSDRANSYVVIVSVLLTLRFLVPFMCGSIRPPAHQVSVPAKTLLQYAALLWIVLLAVGLYRMDWDVVATLYPNGRASEKGSMWGRAAVDTGSGFLVAAGGYLYIMALASFGMLLPLLKSRAHVLFALLLIAISWPYTFMLGARNIALAACMPGILSFALYSRVGMAVKGAVLGALFLVIEFLMRAISLLRNEGFANFFESSATEAKHLGLNMGSELVHIIGFLRRGVIEVQYGWNYLIEFGQFVPRFLWPDKPMLSVEYSIARGFGGAEGEHGVFATIATGAIGEGVWQFGLYAGGPFVALLFAIWVYTLTRLSVASTAPRQCLYLLGLGLTFNMGRGFTLLVLWPFVFGYIAILLLEWRLANAPRRTSRA